MRQLVVRNRRFQRTLWICEIGLIPWISVAFLPMGRQIVDATLVAAPKQRNTMPQKDAIKAGKSAAEIWPDQPASAAQKDTDARWTFKFAKARAMLDGRPGIDIAIPSFGYKSSIAICWGYGFIRSAKVTDDARFDGRMLRYVVTTDNTASDVWADTAYRSRSNEAWLKSISCVHRKKPRGKPMPARTAHANAANPPSAIALSTCSLPRRIR